MLPLYKRSMGRGLSVLLFFLLFFPLPNAHAQFPATRPTFRAEEPTISATFFIWYAANGGQLSGPWIPLEGRENWTGTPDWWKSQIKQVMMANIDMILVHLMHQTDERRVTLFQALYELRQEGYEVPKVIPYLDPLITWGQTEKLDMSKEEDKDTFVDQYIRFYNLYFGQNPDAHAEDYLGKMDGKLILDTWHTFVTVDNIEQLTRADVVQRLAAAFPDRPLFQEGIYMVTTALNTPLITFADERAAKFEINEYYYEVEHNGVTTASLKAGYWDQNIRNPGDFLPRDGGVPYREAWEMVDTSVDRVYIESWNEYDEGTGIYAADVSGPYIAPANTSGNTDLWSDSNDPFEYIRTTAEFGAQFNDIPDLDARILSYSLPDTVEPGGTYEMEVLVQNRGDKGWTGQDGFALGLRNAPAGFSDLKVAIDDTDPALEIDTYESIFRGRPIRFRFSLTVPEAVPDSIQLEFSMFEEDTPFGEQLQHTLQVRNLSTSTRDLPAEPLKIYPNPVGDRLFLSADLSGGQWTIYDAPGRQVRRSTLDPSRKIEVAGLKPGVYFLVLQAGPGGDGARYVARFVKR